MRRLLPVALAVTAVVAFAAAADDSPAPDSVAAAYLGVLVEDGMGAAGRFFDPEGLGALKEVFVALLQSEAQQGQSQLREAMFGPNASLDDVSETEPVAFYSGVMRILEMQMQQANVSFSNGKVLGAVFENPKLAHVVARMDLSTATDSVSSIDTISMREVDGRWVLLLTDDVEQMARVARAQLAAQP